MLILSCKEDFQKEVRTAAYSKADSLFNARISLINSESDSLCTDYKNSKLQFLVDSILEERRKQIQQLRSLE